MTALMIDAYPWIKMIHIAAVISWMAGMFYLPRLFVYHVERSQRGDKSEQTFIIMEEKLLRIIMNPAMIVAWGAGVLMALIPGIIDWTSGWAWMKLLCVIAMTLCHMWLARQRRLLATGECQLSGRSFRLVNEIPTVLMLLILIAIIVRPF